MNDTAVRTKRVVVRCPLVLGSLSFLGMLVAGGTGSASILTTQHNLSISGPGPIKAVSETQVCVFCHTPHKAQDAGPLWNHTLSAAGNYTLPSSPTMLSTPQNPPDGDSRLCLSCHDGTVAVGSVVNLGGAPTTISMQDSGTGTLSAGALAPNAPTNFGTDLSGHHPVSLEVDDALIADKQNQCAQGLVSLKVCMPAAPAKLLSTANLYGTGTHTHKGVQCSSCHDAHEDPVPGTSMFLRADATALCDLCHVSCSASCP